MASAITQALTRRVLTLTRGLVEAEPALLNTQSSAEILLTDIQRIDPGLRRQRKKVLQDTLDAALKTLRAEAKEASSDPLASEDGPLEATSVDNAEDDAEYDMPVDRGPNLMNRSMMALYSRNRPPAPAAVPAQEVPGQPGQLIPPLTELDINGSAAPAEASVVNPGNGNEAPPQEPPAAVAQTPKRKEPVDARKKKGESKRRRTGSTAAGDGGDAQDRSSASALAVAASELPALRLSGLGGLDSCVETLLELVALPLARPEIYAHLGVSPPSGILLHGPPGCGKTSLAHALAGELGVPFFNVAAPAIVSGMSGESEQKIRDIFAQAQRSAPCLVFIDEIDAITPKREAAQREMERRIVAQLLTCMDDVSFDKNGNVPVVVIGATNRPDSIDPALRRAGRFDREIAIGVPDENARVKILQVLLAKLRLAGDFDYRALAKRTPGYVGADLTALTAEAGLLAVKRSFEALEASSGETHALAEGLIDAMEVEVTAPNGDVSADPSATTDTVAVVAEGVNGVPLPDAEARKDTPSKWMPSLEHFSNTTIARFLSRHPSPLSETELAPLAITNADFQIALQKVQPSSKREGFATVPDVTWEQVGALGYVRDELRMAIVEPVLQPEMYKHFGVESPAGVLLWGPPGCGKTLLAKAVANESMANFISVKGPELLNKYVGESERAVRQVFARARASAPCVIFFDEIDALVPRRDDAKSEASARVVNTLLTELDGLEARRGVFIIAATNRPDILDPAMMRPGRLDKLLYVELPTPDERADILAAVARGKPLAPDVDLPRIAADPRCDGFSGADLANLGREAAIAALRQTLFGGAPVPKLTSNGGSKASAADTPLQKKLSASGDAASLAICHHHFELALQKVKPSVSATDRRAYAQLHRKLFGGGDVAKGSNEQASS